MAKGKGDLVFLKQRTWRICRFKGFHLVQGKKTLPVRGTGKIKEVLKESRIITVGYMTESQLRWN